MRVYELAKSLNMSNKDLLERLKKMGIDATNHMTNLNDDDCAAFRNAVSKAKTGKSDYSYSAAQSDSYGYVKPSTGFGRGFVAPQKRSTTTTTTTVKSNRTPARTILVKSKENKKRDEEKVKEFFKDNAIKRMLEEKRKYDIQRAHEEEERERRIEGSGNMTDVFNVGERVFHDKLGIGHILEVIPVGESTMYTIDFGKQGKKAMDASYAHLKKF